MNYGISQLVAGLDVDGKIKVLSVGADGKLQVSGGASGGDANAANQTTQITRETEIRDRLPTVLVSDRLKIDGSGVTQPVSLVNLPSLPTGTNSIGSIANTGFNVTGTLPAFTTTPAFKIDQTISGTTNKVSIGTDGTVGITGSVAVTGSFFQTTQPVSLVNLPSLPTGTNSIGSIANTGFNVTGNLPAFATTPAFKIDQTISGTTNKVSIGTDGTVGITGSIAVTGSFFQTTQPVSLVNLPSLPTGTNSIGSISNTTFAATQSGSWNLNNIAGSITLPTGAATSILQGTGNTSLASIDGKLPVAIGAKTAANSLAVTLATDGVFGTNFGLLTDIAATTDTGSFNLISLIKRLLSITLAKGQQLMTASIPVAIASNQSTLPTFTQGSTTFTLVNNASAAGTGSGVSFVNALQKYSIQLQVVSGTLTAITAEIQISLRNGGWQTIAIFNDIVDGSFIFLGDYPALFMRINITTITGASPVVSYFMVGTI